MLAVSCHVVDHSQVECLKASYSGKQEGTSCTNSKLQSSSCTIVSHNELLCLQDKLSSTIQSQSVRDLNETQPASDGIMSELGFVVPVWLADLLPLACPSCGSLMLSVSLRH